MHTGPGDPEAWKAHQRDRDAEEKLLARFRDPADPLKFLIVTSKLLTGFDAPLLQVMYLDKPMRDTNLVQAICRTNRIYKNKSYGLIVDYIGIFDDVAQALDFDEPGVKKMIDNITEVERAFPGQMETCLAFFPGVDRTVGGYEGLIAAQDCLPDNSTRDKFAAEYTVLERMFEALSPAPCLSPHENDYRWLTQVYESVKPPSGNGKLLWHALGPRTIALIHQNTHLDTVRDDLETLVLDAEVLESVLGAPDPEKKGKALEISLVARLRKHGKNPKFVALGERLEKLKERHEQGLIDSKEFLKQLLALAREALTELFQQVKNEATPIIVERIVTDIDEIVRMVRFPGWQQTSAGEREVQKALRRTLLKYKLHTDQDLFDRAYGYIKEYY